MTGEPQDNRQPSDFPVANELYGIAKSVGIPEDVVMQVVDYTVAVIHFLRGEEWVDPQGIIHCGLLLIEPETPE